MLEVHNLVKTYGGFQAVKGVSVGEAWEVAGKPGSESHDEIFWSEERGWHRETNRAGGVEGGMSNGEALVVRGALDLLAADPRLDATVLQTVGEKGHDGFAFAVVHA